MPPKKRRRAPNTRLPSKDVSEYSSDGHSFDVSDDDLPDLSNLSPKKDRKFNKDDVVWAPFRDMYWPAVVTSVSTSHVRFLWVNEKRGKSSVYKTKPSNIIAFDDAATNARLKQLGEKKCHIFKEAYELVTKYFLQKCESSELSARRFLTLAEKTGDISFHQDILYRLGIESYVSNDVQLCIDEYGDESEDEEEEPPKEDENVSHIDEFEKEFQALPEIENQVLDRLAAEAEQLLTFISSEECFEYLKGVKEGSLPSSRHKLYPNPELKWLSGLGPFSMHEDLKTKLLDLIENIYDRLNVCDLDYRSLVILPEAIIFGYMKLKSIDNEQASSNFMETSSIVGKRIM